MGLLNIFATCYLVVTGSLVILQGGVITYELFRSYKDERNISEKRHLKQD